MYPKRGESMLGQYVGRRQVKQHDQGVGGQRKLPVSKVILKQMC